MPVNSPLPLPGMTPSTQVSAEELLLWSIIDRLELPPDQTARPQPPVASTSEPSQLAPFHSTTFPISRVTPGSVPPDSRVSVSGFGTRGGYDTSVSSGYITAPTVGIPSFSITPSFQPTIQGQVADIHRQFDSAFNNVSLMSNMHVRIVRSFFYADKKYVH